MESLHNDWPSFARSHGSALKHYDETELCRLHDALDPLYFLQRYICDVRFPDNFLVLRSVRRVMFTQQVDSEIRFEMYWDIIKYTKNVYCRAGVYDDINHLLPVSVILQVMLDIVSDRFPGISACSQGYLPADLAERLDGMPGSDRNLALVDLMDFMDGCDLLLESAGKSRGVMYGDVVLADMQATLFMGLMRTGFITMKSSQDLMFLVYHKMDELYDTWSERKEYVDEMLASETGKRVLSYEHIISRKLKESIDMFDSIVVRDLVNAAVLFYPWGTCTGCEREDAFRQGRLVHKRYCLSCIPVPNGVSVYDDEGECGICFTEFEYDKIILPCGHVVCLTCSNRLEGKCHLCRKQF